MSIEVQGVSPLLQVFDMPTSIRFYRDVLGFRITGISRPMSDDPDDVNWVMLQLGEGTVMLNTAYEKEYRPSTPIPEQVRSHDDTCLYFGCPDVDGAFSYLSSKGLQLKPPEVAHYGMKQLYLKDPDGFGLCFQWTA